MSTALSVEKLGKTYITRTGELPILHDVNLTMSGGEAAAVIGPSGSGKSTLLHLLGGLDRPTTGDIVVNGQRPLSMDSTRLAKFRNRTVGFVFQDHHLLPQCTVLENVLIPTLADGGATKALEDRARGLLDKVGLASRLTHRPSELSGGERQRVALARALIQEPALLLCDEPTGNLDPKSASVVADMLLELGRHPSVMLIVVTHSMDLASRLPRKLEIRDGTLN
jgi:lipoprotein-releasing system ATP-binding protein